MATFDLTTEILRRLTTSPVTTDRVIAARYVGATSTSGELVDACRVFLARDTSPEVRAAMEFSIPPTSSKAARKTTPKAKATPAKPRATKATPGPKKRQPKVTESAPVIDVQADEPTVTERVVVDACLDAPLIAEDVVQYMSDSLP